MSNLNLQLKQAGRELVEAIKTGASSERRKELSEKLRRLQSQVDEKTAFMKPLKYKKVRSKSYGTEI